MSEIIITEIDGKVYTTTITDPTADKLARIAELEAELAQWTEPSDAELIIEGRMMHPYYMKLQEIEMMKGI